MKDYLIIGGTGTVGSEVVRQLTAQRETVYVLTRSEEKAAALPDGATGIVGDLQDPVTYPEIFSDARKVFLVNSVAPTELQEGLAAVNEARRVGVERLVYMSVQNAERGMNIPHFAAKVAIEQALAESGISYTILRPSGFYQNDVWLKEPVTRYKIYPQPNGDIGLSRIDSRDIATAAVRALTQSGHENKTYTLVGPNALTGQDTAAILSEVLGEEIRYGGNDLDAWAQQAAQMMPPWMVYDIRLMLELFQREGLVATGQQIAETRTILGGEPRPYREFAQEMVSNW